MPTAGQSPEHSAEEILLAFAAAVRAAGVKVTADRSLSFVDAVGRLTLDRRSDVFWAGRATLCASPEDLPAYQRTFEAWFAVEHSAAQRLENSATSVSAATLDDDDGGPEGRREQLRALASRRELLRHRDVAVLDDAERALLHRMFEELPVRLPTRQTRRKHLDRHGDVDRVRTLRDQLRRGGEPGPLRRARAPAQNPPDGLVDRRFGFDGTVRGQPASLGPPGSGSRPAPGGGVHDRHPPDPRDCALRVPDPDNALALAGRTVPDWSGGTRLGEVLRAFNDRWGQRVMVRGAVVVIASDGWERGDPALLGRQAERLHHLARRIIWSNPHRGKAGYEPLQRGIRAVLPHVDFFIGGHSMQSFEELLDVVANA